MKIFTYGIDDKKMDSIRWHFGRAEYVDTTMQYQDILALCADVVVINVDNASSEVLTAVRQYETETKDVDDTQYHYITDEDLEKWIKEYYCKLEEAIERVSMDVSLDEFEAVQLFGIQKYHNGNITKAYTQEEGKIKFYEYFRHSQGKNELLILSLGDNPIDAKTYHMFDERYDIVSVAWFREIQSKRQCLRELFEYRTDMNELPPVLRGIKTKLDDAVEPYLYAYFGE